MPADFDRKAYINQASGHVRVAARPVISTNSGAGQANGHVREAAPPEASAIPGAGPSNIKVKLENPPNPALLRSKTKASLPTTILPYLFPLYEFH